MIDSKEVGTFGTQFKQKYKLFGNVWAGDHDVCILWLVLVRLSWPPIPVLTSYPEPFIFTWTRYDGCR